MDITSKYSFYDMLAMIIPGGIVIAGLAKLMDLNCFTNVMVTCCGYKFVHNDFGILEAVIFLCSAYVIGLINNWICDGVFRGFRNNYNAIENGLMRVLQDNENLYLKTHGIRWNCGTNSQVKSQWKIISMVSKNIYRSLFKSNHSEKNTVYYRFYYALNERKLLGNIPIIESQVALLRNSLFPLTLLAIVLGVKCKWFWFLMIFPIIMSYLVMIQRQNKIYCLIWEAANYYKL